MAYLSPVELARVAGIRPNMLTLLMQLMANFEARTGKRTFVPAFGGVRSLADQTALVNDRNAQGASYPVATPGRSRHEYGGAADLNIIGETTGDPQTDARNPAYRALADEARALGLVAGIGFSNTDPYHFELAESLSDAQAAWSDYQKKKATSSAGPLPSRSCCG